jgi:hypothetical protein
MGAAQVGTAGFRKSAQGVVQNWQNTSETWWVGRFVCNNTYDTAQRCENIQWGPHIWGLQDFENQPRCCSTMPKTHQKLSGWGAVCAARPVTIHSDVQTFNGGRTSWDCRISKVSTRCCSKMSKTYQKLGGWGALCTTTPVTIHNDVKTFNGGRTSGECRISKNKTRCCPKIAKHTRNLVGGVLCVQQHI